MVNVDLFFNLKIAKAGFGPFLMLGKIENLKEKLNLFFIKNNISQADQIFVEPAEGSGSITIDQIREGSIKAMRKPFNSEHKALIVTYASLLTLPAQNAFLKSLEEPSPHTLIFLLSESDDGMLPTIKSRVKTFNLLVDQSEKHDLSEIKDLLNRSRGDRILWAQQNYSQIGDINTFLDKILLFTNSDLNRLHNSVDLIHKVYKGKRALKNNVSDKLILEYILT